MINNWKDKKVAIIGIGVEGLSSALYLKQIGADITFLDAKDEPDSANFEVAKKITDSFILGKDYLSQLDKFTVVIRSPGVKTSLPELVEARKKGVVVTSQTQLFFEMCPGKIIGVTGTKGKGTTSSILYEMLKAQGKDAYLGGNIGHPPFAFLDNLTRDSWVVLELSSFQLQDLSISPTDAKAMEGKPHIAVVLMITSDHLDYHEDTLEYVAAKRNILNFQTSEDFTIVNRDYPASNESDVLTNGTVFKVSRERDTDNGCYVVGTKVIVKRNGQENEIIDIADILLPGKHNLENVCAAVMAASLAGVQKKHMVQVLKEFPGLTHRLELIREVDSVRYYDDSISTTPETAIAAIQSFISPEILILGGSSKGSDFTELGKVIAESENIKAIIGYGKEWEKIKETIHQPKHEFILIEGADSMSKIVQAAATIAIPGDVVLLSPGCASFDMYKNYKERGNEFKKEVMRIGKN